MKKLEKIIAITGTLTLDSGLHIGSDDSEIKIGGTDSSVVKHPHSDEPYIPGSSLKGKIRSLLEWESGAMEHSTGGAFAEAVLAKISSSELQEKVKLILSLFGSAGERSETNECNLPRLIFRDSFITKTCIKECDDNNFVLTEAKMENTINRKNGRATSPRSIERVPSGIKFAFCLNCKIYSGDNEVKYKNTILKGLKLLELDYLGGSGTRGYGKVSFNELKYDNQEVLLPDNPFN